MLVSDFGGVEVIRLVLEVGALGRTGLGWRCEPRSVLSCGIEERSTSMDSMSMRPNSDIGRSLSVRSLFAGCDDGVGDGDREDGNAPGIASLSGDAVSIH